MQIYEWKVSKDRTDAGELEIRRVEAGKKQKLESLDGQRNTGPAVVYTVQFSCQDGHGGGPSSRSNSRLSIDAAKANPTMDPCSHGRHASVALHTYLSLMRRSSTISTKVPWT